MALHHRRQRDFAADAPAHRELILSGYWRLSDKIPADKKLHAAAARKHRRSGGYRRRGVPARRIRRAETEAGGRGRRGQMGSRATTCRSPTRASRPRSSTRCRALSRWRSTRAPSSSSSSSSISTSCVSSSWTAAKPDATTPDSKSGFSVGHWEGDTLVVDTTHLEAATITNNGLSHSNKVHVIERFRLSEDGRELHSTQEFEDPLVLDNRGARFIAWKKDGRPRYPYECDPTFALEYQNQIERRQAVSDFSRRQFIGALGVAASLPMLDSYRHPRRRAGRGACCRSTPPRSTTWTSSFRTSRKPPAST